MHHKWCRRLWMERIVRRIRVRCTVEEEQREWEREKGEKRARAWRRARQLKHEQKKRRRTGYFFIAMHSDYLDVKWIFHLIECSSGWIAKSERKEHNTRLPIHILICPERGISFATSESAAFFSITNSLCLPVRYLWNHTGRQMHR